MTAYRCTEASTRNGPTGVDEALEQLLGSYRLWRGRDGVLHESERALLTFIKATAPHIDPGLNALFEKAGV